jgi:predicted dehydrogenase
MDHVIRLGVLSTAKITGSLMRAVPGLGDRMAVTHVASRRLESAEAWAGQWGVPHALGSYDELIDCSEVDAVYVALPAAMHGEWCSRAVRAGKHVLCEKPLTANSAEARALVDEARVAGRVLMEAMHYRYHPMAQRAYDIVAGELAPIWFVEGGFLHAVPDPANIRRHFGLGGGATMDFGCYPLHWIRSIAGEPFGVEARTQADDDGVDYRMEADLRFDQGVLGRFVVSMETRMPDRFWLHVEGTGGTLDAEGFVTPRVLTVRGSAGERDELAPLDSPTTFDYQLRHFCDCVADGSEPLTGGHDSVANMAAIDAIYRAAGLPLRQPWAGPG